MPGFRVARDPVKRIGEKSCGNVWTRCGCATGRGGPAKDTHGNNRTRYGHKRQQAGTVRKKGKRGREGDEKKCARVVPVRTEKVGTAVGVVKARIWLTTGLVAAGLAGLVEALKKDDEHSRTVGMILWAGPVFAHIASAHAPDAPWRRRSPAPALPRQ